MIEFAIEPVRLFSFGADSPLRLDVKAEVAPTVDCVLIHKLPIHVLAGDGFIEREINADAHWLERHKACHEHVGDCLLTEVASFVLISIQYPRGPLREIMCEATKKIQVSRSLDTPAASMMD